MKKYLIAALAVLLLLVACSNEPKYQDANIPAIFHGIWKNSSQYSTYRISNNTVEFNRYGEWETVLDGKVISETTHDYPEAVTYECEYIKPTGKTSYLELTYHKDWEILSINGLSHRKN